MVLRSTDVGNGRITGAHRLMDGGSIPPSSTNFSASDGFNIGILIFTLLKFSDNKGKASQFMEGHREWINRGLDDGVFLLVGSLQPNLGGGILARNTTLHDLQSRVNNDPFVVENVMNAEILEITPSKADARLNFLLD
jgi:uncharacterized protein YciI